MGDVGGLPCLPQPLNTTVVQDIFYNINPFLSCDDNPPTPFTMYFIPG